MNLLRGVKSFSQGRNEGGLRGTISQAPNHYGGAESLWGVPNDCGRRRKVPTRWQVLSSIQYICFRNQMRTWGVHLLAISGSNKASGSKQGAPNLLLAPGAI